MKKVILFSIILLFLLISFSSAARLPTIGGDNDAWGTVLNEFLNVSLNDTGHLRESYYLLSNPFGFYNSTTLNNNNQIANGNNYWNDTYATFNKTYADTLYALIGGGGISGRGIFGYLPLWNSTSSINNSVIFQLGNNVGIGTTSPAGKLDVVSSSSATNPVIISTNDLGVQSIFYTGRSGASTTANKTVITNANGDDILLNYNGGNVGIGTTSPAGLLHLYSTSTSTTLGQLGTDIYLDQNSATVNAGGEIVFRGRGTEEGNRNYAAVTGQVKALGATGTAGGLVFSTKNLQADTALTERMTILRSGEVGIGTTSPGSLLEISSTNPNLRFNETDSAQTWQLRSAAGIFTINDITGGTLTPFQIEPATPSSTLYLDSTGRVGIGTTSPIQMLDVRGGTVLAGTAAATTGSLQFAGFYNTGDDLLNTYGSHYSSGATLVGYAVRGKSGAAGYTSTADNSNFYRGVLSIEGELEFLNSGAQTTAVGSDVTMTSRFIIDSTGNVGIGTTSPNDLLSVVESGGVTTFNGFVTQSVANASIALGLSSKGGDLMRLYGSATGASEKVRITNDGNVGIGTASPAAKLQVGAGVIAPFLTTPNITTQVSSTTEGDEVAYTLYSNEGTNQRRVKFFLDDTTGVWGLDGTASSNVQDFQIQRGGTSVFHIEMTAAPFNVGIGTTSPARNLHINDTMRIQPRATAPTSAASGDLYVDSTPAADELCFYDGAAWQGLSSGTDANCA